MRYERRAHEHFREMYGDRYIQSPWLKYMLIGETRYRFAQPDALLVDLNHGIITVCEMKYQHTCDSYWQTIGKYVPLLQKIFPQDLWQLPVVEVVKWYDCAVEFPTQVKLCENLERASVDSFGVHIFKPAAR